MENNQPDPLSGTLAKIEQRAIEQALAELGGNRTRAAKRLGISVRTLQRKLSNWGIQDRKRCGATA